LQSIGKVQVLKQSLIFSSLNEGEAAELARLAIERSFTPGDFVFWDGDAPDWFYMVAEFQKPETTGVVSRDAAYQQSMLSHWPVQLALVPPAVPFLQGADLILTADCVPFAYASFHHDLLRGHALLVACPKLDDSEAHQRNLTDILSHSEVKSLTVVHMEVPCCSSLAHMAKQAIQQSGKDIPFKERTIGIRGDVKS